MASEGEVIVEPAASALGTKEHWDKVYEREITQFHENQDIGEIWFGEEVERKMVRWVKKSFMARAGRDDPQKIRVLELGCGNGHLLLELASEGFGTLVGVDYSAPAVHLAQSVAVGYVEENELENVSLISEEDLLASGGEEAIRKRLEEKGEDGEEKEAESMAEESSAESASASAAVSGADAEDSNQEPNNMTILTFVTADILKEPPTILVPTPFDLVLDKGTFDAISLSQNSADKLHYPASVRRWIRSDGIFLITSCNWTREELVRLFHPHFELLDEVKNREFQFGGVKGQTVTTLAFVVPKEK